MADKTLHIVSHTHWDREWYMSFEEHRMRLVELMDTLIETMEAHPDYKYFHLDGQYIVIEDYLEIKPHMRDRLLKLIREDRIQIGPFYILQDEYLTSGEANVRNALYGIKLCKEIGAEPVMSGYFPDAFGNISQIPQILKGFNIDNAIFGRGVGSILADNKVSNEAIKKPSELIWSSPDGSEVIGVMFAAWYHNAMELPTDKELLKGKIERMTTTLKNSAATDHLLGMNGCDHQPVQTDLHIAIKNANEIFGEELEVKHSNFKDLLNELRPYKDKFTRLQGEINGQRTSGAFPLVCTASSHIGIKQKNHKGQNILERIAEPMNMMSMLLGGEYYNDQLFYSWKTLMQNHPHDSICSCSCDDVISEMTTRFQKSYKVAEYVTGEAKDFIVNNIDSASISDKCITVFHTSPLKSTGVVSAFVDYPEDSDVENIYLTDSNGNIVPAVVENLGRTFKFELPKDKFRKSSFVKRFKVSFKVTEEGLGYETFAVNVGKKEFTSTVSATDTTLQNEFISLIVEPNGTVTVLDKQSGYSYKNNLIFEDSGDIGNLYNYIEAENSERIYANAGALGSKIFEVTPYSATLVLKSKLQIPKSRDLDSRSSETIPHEITTYLTVTDGVKRIDVKTEITNESEDHRLRALFVPEIITDTVDAEGQFDVVHREIVPADTWKNPCYCQRIQTFFALQDQDKGLMIATRGLNEYEILRDGKNTMALTLLRAVGEVGDWGVFPTPNGQVKGEHSLQYSIIPFSKTTKALSRAEAFQFNGDQFVAKAYDSKVGTLSPTNKLFTLSGDNLSFAAFKKAEDRNSGILRFYNSSDETQKAVITLNSAFKNAYITNLAEERQENLKITDNRIELSVGKKKIVTIELEK